MLSITIDLKYVYRYKVCTNFYGPAPMCIETISVVASSADDASRYIHKIFEKRGLYSFEILDKTECIVL